jgi:uncharacterized membrane protein YidH (DUF202 family)
VTSQYDPEDHDPAGARARTRLAWTRTALAFAALGAVVLKTSVATGITILALAPVSWHIGRLSGSAATGKPRARQLLLIAVAVTAFALAVLILVLLGHGRSAGFHPPLRRLG